MSKSLNRPLKILLTTNALVLLAGTMLSPIYALYVEKIGGDLMDASLAGGIFALAAGIATIISGKFSDKIKENELIIVFGYFVMGLGFLSYYWVSSVYQLFVVQAIIGFGEAVYSPAFDAVYSRHLTGKQYGSQWGAWESMNYFTTTLGSVIGGAIATFFGFPILFVIIACLCFFSGIYIYHLKRTVL